MTLIEKEAVLKPCPFCGKDEAIVVGSGLFCVQCKHCGALTAWSKSREAAIEHWNRRAPIPSAREGMEEELAKALRVRVLNMFLSGNCSCCGGYWEQHRTVRVDGRFAAGAVSTRRAMRPSVPGMTAPVQGKVQS